MKHMGGFWSFALGGCHQCPQDTLKKSEEFAVWGQEDRSDFLKPLEKYNLTKNWCNILQCLG